MVRRLLAVAVVIGVVACKAAAQEGNPQPGDRASIVTRFRAEKRSRERLADAVRDLLAEYDAHLRDPAATLRSESDYFSNAGEVVQRVLLETLRRRLSDDLAADCYVKWQLLSAVEKFDDDLLPDALALYRGSPRLVVRPGVDPREKQELDQLALRVRKETAIDAINRRLSDAVAQVVSQNEPVLAYRDALYARLPPGPEAFAAAIEDLADRLDGGVVSKAFVDARLEEIGRWSSGGAATTEQMQRVAALLARLRRYDGPQYHSELDWSKGRAVWRKKRDGYGRSQKLKALIDDLYERSGRPAEIEP